MWYRGSAGSIAADPKIPIWDVNEAQKVIRSIYDRYGGVEQGQQQDYDNTILAGGRLITPTGRCYFFDTGSYRLKFQVANYPIQSGATADLIPCAMIVIHRLMKRLSMKSLTMGNVHDSIVFDVFPGEEELLSKVAVYAFVKGCKAEWYRRFGMKFDFPLSAGTKLKEHW